MTRAFYLGASLCLLVGAAVSIARSGHTEEPLDLVAVSLETDRLAAASFEEMVGRERRLIEVSTRVRRAGVELCRDHLAPILGIQVMSTRGLPAAYITAAIRSFGVGEPVRVVWVLPDSAGARAGLAPGDELASVDGSKIDLEQELNNRRAAAGAKSLRFVIRRNGEKRDVEVPYEPGCYVQPLLALSSQWNAYASGHDRRIVVFSELMRDLKNDDELVAVLGHELAHIVLGHDRSAPNAEGEADYFGLYLAARAGYDPAAGAQVWRRIARTQPWALIGSETHPSAPQRALAATRATQEIQAKRADGRPLEPEGLR